MEPIPMPTRRPQPQAQSQMQQQVLQQAQPVKLASTTVDFAKRQPKASAFLDTLSGSVNSGNLATSPELTVGDMVTYARRKYAAAHKSDRLDRKDAMLIGGDIVVASNIDPHRTEPSGASFVKAEGDVD
jgi:hypothetical protein